MASPGVPQLFGSESAATTCSEPSSQTNRVASSPFNKTGADVVLRACNKIDFYVYKAVLLLASDFFEDMFSLKQPAEDSGTIEGRPIVEVSETSDTIDMLLRLCYPVDDPNISTLAELDSVLSAAIKYEMREAIQILRRLLQTYVPEKPREVYAIACRHMLETEAGMAAKRWKEIVQAIEDATDFALTLPGATFIPEMQDISALSYYNLLSYLRSGKNPTRFCQDTNTTRSLHFTYENEPPAAFAREDADIVLLSSDDVSFRAHKVILTMNGVDDLLGNALHIGESGGLPILQVDISAFALGYFLQLCYPAGVSSSSTHPGSRTYDEVVRFAAKHNIDIILRLLRRELKYAFEGNHMTRYLISMRYGWHPEAHDAARCLAEAPLDTVYSEEFTTAAANAYQTLLEYHHRYQVAVMQAHEPCAIYRGYHDIDVSTGQWKQLWFNAARPARPRGYLRTVPYVLAELDTAYARRNSRSLDAARIIRLTDELERRVKSAVEDLQLNLGKKSSQFEKLKSSEDIMSDNGRRCRI